VALVPLVGCCAVAALPGQSGRRALVQVFPQLTTIPLAIEAQLPTVAALLVDLEWQDEQPAACGGDRRQARPRRHATPARHGAHRHVVDVRGAS